LGKVGFGAGTVPADNEWCGFPTSPGRADQAAAEWQFDPKNIANPRKRTSCAIPQRHWLEFKNRELRPPRNFQLTFGPDWRVGNNSYQTPPSPGTGERTLPASGNGSFEATWAPHLHPRPTPVD